MRFQVITPLLILIISFSLQAQTIKIIESNSEHIKLEFSFPGYYSLKEKVLQGKKFTYIEKNGISLRKPGEPWLPTQNYKFGIPYNKLANYKILKIEQEKIPNISMLPYPDSLNQPIERLKFDPLIYNKNKYFPLSPINVGGYFMMRYVNGASIEIAPYQYNPITRELLFNKNIIVQINYDSDPHKSVNINNIRDKFTEDFVATVFINPKEAKEFIGKPIKSNSLNPDNADPSHHKNSITSPKIIK
jgi:hypothetical protein